MTSKNFTLLCIIILIFFSACTNGERLAKGELKYQINNQGDVIFSGNLLATDIALFIPIELTGTEESICLSIAQYYSDLGTTVAVHEYKKKNDYVHFIIEYSDPSTLYIQTNNSLDHFATTSYESFEEMVKWETFIDYKTKSPIIPEVLLENQYAKMLTVNGSNSGSFYEVPGDILFISDEMNYKKINSTIIYIESGHFGIIVYAN